MIDGVSDLETHGIRKRYRQRGTREYKKVQDREERRKGKRKVRQKREMRSRRSDEAANSGGRVKPHRVKWRTLVGL